MYSKEFIREGCNSSCQRKDSSGHHARGRRCSSGKEGVGRPEPYYSWDCWDRPWIRIDHHVGRVAVICKGRKRQKLPLLETEFSRSPHRLHWLTPGGLQDARPTYKQRHGEEWFKSVSRFAWMASRRGGVTGKVSDLGWNLAGTVSSSGGSRAPESVRL